MKLIHILMLGLTLVAAAGQQAAPAGETRESGVVKAVRKTTPAVVNISSQYEIRKKSNPFSGYGMDPMLERFFRDFFSPEMERRNKQTSLGSGVIIDGERGLVLTNAHVIEKSETIRVVLNDEREFSATIVGMDPDSDLALLKVQSEQPLPALALGNSDEIMIGESVIAIGNPFGFSHTVTTGVVSALNRSIKTSDRIFHQFIQTDASINPGNSGGPLLNIDGELIGINTAIYAQAQGIGFAIPINRAKRIVSDLVTYGEVVQPWCGFSVQPLEGGLAAYLSVDHQGGVMVAEVEPGSPAALGGIEEGDILLSIDGFKITGMADYQVRMNQIAVGQTLTLEVSRGGKKYTASLKTALFPMDRALELAQRLLGVTVTALDEQTRSTYGISQRTGVLILTLRRHTPLERIGVRPGDIIRQFDEIRIDHLADFQTAMVKYRNKPSVVVVVQRDGHLYPIHVIMKETP